MKVTPRLHVPRNVRLLVQALEDLSGPSGVVQVTQAELCARTGLALRTLQRTIPLAERFGLSHCLVGNRKQHRTEFDLSTLHRHFRRSVAGMADAPGHWRHKIAANAHHNRQHGPTLNTASRSIEQTTEMHTDAVVAEEEPAAVLQRGKNEWQFGIPLDQQTTPALLYHRAFLERRIAYDEAQLATMSPDEVDWKYTMGGMRRTQAALKRVDSLLPQAESGR